MCKHTHIVRMICSDFNTEPCSTYSNHWALKR